MTSHIDTTIRSKKVNTIRESVEKIDFDTIDSKGKKIGALIVRDTETYEVMTDADIKASIWASHVKPGVWFTYRIQTTRNGSAFGATQPKHYFATVEERDVAIHAHLARSMKTAAKKAA